MSNLINKKTGKNFEVYNQDLDNRYSWENAKIEIKKLGEGWRIPTIDELETIYDNSWQIDVNPLEREWYWSSSGNGSSTSFCFDFNDGERKAYYKEGKGLIRPVRNSKKIKI
jgi:hypothetical protein